VELVVVRNLVLDFEGILCMSVYYRRGCDALSLE
jgi:hypothetical protein